MSMRAMRLLNTPLLRRAKQQVSEIPARLQLYDFDWGITYQYFRHCYDKDYD